MQQNLVLEDRKGRWQEYAYTLSICTVHKAMSVYSYSV